MNEKELYQQKMKAQLDEWKADIEKIRAKAAGITADAKLQIHEHVQDLEAKIEDGKKRLAELADASEDAWDSVQEGAESAWEALKSSLEEAKSKFKD